MRPPICEVCHRDFSAKSGRLVRFTPTDAGTRWQTRDNPGPGHHLDDGWFCEVHAEVAGRLAETHTLREAVAALRPTKPAGSSESDTESDV